jgi:hypothetical protein
MKKISQSWILEDIQEGSSFLQKPMFGGLAVYLHGRMMMVLVESKGKNEWRGVSYPTPIWQGVLLPTDRDHHVSLIAQFPGLIPHVVLGKWLYLACDQEDYEEVIVKLVSLIEQNDMRFGIIPKDKKGSKNKKNKKTKKK